jgi:hypothetical protein
MQPQLSNSGITHSGDTNIFIHQLMEQMQAYSELEDCSVTWEFYNNELEYE